MNGNGLHVAHAWQRFQSQNKSREHFEPGARDWQRFPVEEQSREQSIEHQESRFTHRTESLSMEEYIEDLEDIIKNKETPLEEDTYGHVISSIVRDVGWLEKGTNFKMLRVARLISAICLLVITMGLQVLILYFVRQLLTATAVHEIRDIYSHYEKIMYPNHTTFFYHVGGLVYYRGIPGYRVDANFALISDDEKEELCQIPLSQPLYLCTILLIWTLTCAYQLRCNQEQFMRLIWRVGRIKHMTDSTEQKEEDPAVLIIKGLTWKVKAALVILVFFPQAFMTCLLCWLGSRWMTATADLQDLLLNAVALEFVLLLKESLYKVLVPRRAKLETQCTYVEPDEYHEDQSLSLSVSFGSFLWGAVAVFWVLLYVLVLQHVLVDYKWDVRDLCQPYLAEQRMV